MTSSDSDRTARLDVARRIDQPVGGFEILPRDLIGPEPAQRGFGIAQLVMDAHEHVLPVALALELEIDDLLVPVRVSVEHLQLDTVAASLLGTVHARSACSSNVVRSACGSLVVTTPMLACSSIVNPSISCGRDRSSAIRSATACASAAEPRSSHRTTNSSPAVASDDVVRPHRSREAPRLGCEHAVTEHVAVKVVRPP